MLGVPQYGALIINNQTVSSVDATESLIKMASNGLPIIFVGSPPSQAYPTNASSQDALRSTMARLMSQSGVYSTQSVDQLPAILAEKGIKPRVALNCSSNPVYSVWRSTADIDYVYIFNDQSKDVTCATTITASGVVPHVLNAFTSSQTPLLQYSYTNSTLSVPLALRSNETLILALQHSSTVHQCTFPRSSGSLHSLNASSDGIEAVITGSTTLTSSSGKTSEFNSSLPARTNLAFWDWVIEDYHSAPDRYAIQTEITNHTYQNLPLVPWSQFDASITPVSGVGHYTTRFTVPASPTNSSSLVGILKLPLIQHTARVFLDSKWLGPIDPVNPVLTIPGLKSGQEHGLRIDITTTLFNRIKAEANQTWVVGGVAGIRQPKYNTMPYEEYGLVGSVVIEWGETVSVEC